MTGHDRNEEIEFMQNPDKWPHGFVLPLKRWTAPSQMDTGFLFQGSIKSPAPPPEPVIYIGNMFAGKFEGLPTKEYPSLEAILDDGWVID
jgi:hypothetical protein